MGWYKYLLFGPVAVCPYIAHITCWQFDTAQEKQKIWSLTLRLEKIQLVSWKTSTSTYQTNCTALSLATWAALGIVDTATDSVSPSNISRFGIKNLKVCIVNRKCSHTFISNVVFCHSLVLISKHHSFLKKQNLPLTGIQALFDTMSMSNLPLLMFEKCPHESQSTSHAILGKQDLVMSLLESDSWNNRNNDD